jgi:membrane protease YdiL (CAAX protease family)
VPAQEQEQHKDDDATDAADAPRWGMGYALVGYAAAFILANLFVAAYATATHLDNGDTTLGVTIAGLLGLWLGMLGAIVLAARRYGRDRQPAGLLTTLRRHFGLEFRWSDLPIGALAGLASQLILVRLLYLPFELRDPDLNTRLEKPARQLTDLAHGPGFVVLAILITLGAPLVEELFFRGLLQRPLLTRMRPPIAIAVSALAFGLAHYQPLQLLGLVGFGIVLGSMAWRTGRLGPGIVAHVFFNLVTVVALAANRS